MVRQLGSVCAALWSAPTAYLLGLLAAAARGARGRRGPAAPGEHLELVVLVPAHNEEKVIDGTLAAVEGLDYPPDRFEVVVIADNCDDRTAQVAREAGATVLVRFDAERRGKGWALAWALERLREGRQGDAVVFLDADCQPSPNLLRILDARLRAGYEAVQASYVVSNPHESWSSALRYAAFSLMNWVRPLGKDALGLSCGILGTGFALTWDLLERHPWDTFSLSEDHDYHLGLVAAGVRVGFAPEALVSSAMPTTLRDSREQNLRWEGGRASSSADGRRSLCARGCDGVMQAACTPGWSRSCPHNRSCWSETPPSRRSERPRAAGACCALRRSTCSDRPSTSSAG